LFFGGCGFLDVKKYRALLERYRAVLQRYRDVGWPLCGYGVISMCRKESRGVEVLSQSGKIVFVPRGGGSCAEVKGSFVDM